MRPAGLWVRSMTTVIDLLIATGVVAAVMGLISLTTQRGSGDWGGLVFVGYAAIGALLIARSGRTPGQWLFELEVIDVTTGGKPPLSRAALRMVLPIAVPCIGMLIKFALEQAGYRLYKGVSELLSATVIIAPLALCWASLRSVSKQTFWDKLSKTMVRYRTRRGPAI
jgi:hypothetical protein